MYIGQASPDSLDSGDLNGELVNGTGEDHPEIEGDRRPSLNASTPDDDLGFRERTSTVPIPPAREIAQLFMDQSAAAQSQPDLLGLPYTAHENVLMRRKNLDHSLSVSPAQLNSRLSMPAFVFSCSSLRGSENSPSTSSSFANDMALRAGGTEGEGTGENSEADDTSLNEQVNRNLNNDLETTCDSIESNTDSTRDSPSGSQVQPTNEVEDDHSNTSVTNSEPEGSTECVPSTSTNSDTILNEANNGDTNETSEVSDIQGSDTEHTSETVHQQDEPFTDERDNENVGHANEVGDFSTEATAENISTDDSSRNESNPNPEPSSVTDNSLVSQQDLTESVEVTPSSEDNSSSLQHLSQHEVLIVGIPSDAPDSSLGNSDVLESRPVNNVDDDRTSGILQETNIESDNANRPTTSTVNDSATLSATETQDSSNASTSSLEHSDQQLQFHDENDISHNSIQHSSLAMFGADMTAASFMDLESEPDIMNVLSVSNAATSDVVMPTQSADIEGTSPRRTVGSCNLRTLFQIPDGESVPEVNDNMGARIQDVERSDGINVSENGVAAIAGNDDSNDITQPDGETSSYIGASGFIGRDLSAHEGANVSAGMSSSSAPVVENTASAGAQILDITPGNEQFETEQVTLEEATTTTEDDLSESVIVENPHSTSTVASDDVSQLFDEFVSQRTTLPSPVPSITHVRYLRSKNVSIRLPSRTASPLPVVHVVPPNVPVSRTNSESDFGSVEADPILPATRLDSPVRETSLVLTRSLARDVFDAPDGSREAINEGASTSHSGVSLSEATAETATSSVPGVSNSGPKRRSQSGSSQSGSARNKRKNKSRARTSRHASGNEPTDDAEFVGQARRRASEERPNRNNRDNTVEETNDESSPTHRPASIYVQISDFARDEDALDEPLPPRKSFEFYVSKMVNWLCYNTISCL